MKWRLALCTGLISLLLIPLNIAPAHAAVKEEQLPNISVVPSTEQVKAGDTFEVAIWLQRFKGDYSEVQGYEVHIDYDPSLIQPVEQENKLTPAVFGTSNNVLTLANQIDPKGTITISQALTAKDNSGLFSGYGKIGLIRFKAVAEGDAALTITKSIIIKLDNPGINIKHSATSAVVNIVKEKKAVIETVERTAVTGSEPITIAAKLTSKQIIDRYKDAELIASLGWAVDGIANLSADKTIQGYDTGRYEPNRNMTRAEFAKVAVILLGLNMKQHEASGFTDMKRTEWSYDYVETAAHYELVRGSVSQEGNILFRPNDPITRAEIAAVIARHMQSADVKFPSSPIVNHTFTDIDSHWAKQEITLLYGAGLVQGRSAASFAPDQEATRAEVAVLLSRLSEYMSSVKESN